MERLTNDPKRQKYMSPRAEAEERAARKAGLKGVLRLLIFFLIITVLYLGYLIIDYHRIDDNQAIMPEGRAKYEMVETGTGREYHLTGWNIGYAANTADYTFFMSGGIYARAISKESTIENMNAIIDALLGFRSDFYTIQEVDTESTRSYKVNEDAMIRDAFGSSCCSTFGKNYESSYLFFPVMQPIGRSNSGLVTLSSFAICDSLRKSLPISETYEKYLDLDRCFTVNRMDASNGKELILINLHLSAYGADGDLKNRQIEAIYQIAEAEYAKGNYVICEGDFNADLLGDSASVFGVHFDGLGWAQPFSSRIPDGFRLEAPLDAQNPVPTCRNTNIEYDPAESIQVTVDGFLVSDNVHITRSEVTDLQFACSDHNPVQLYFTLD